MLMMSKITESSDPVYLSLIHYRATHKEQIERHTSMRSTGMNQVMRHSGKPQQSNEAYHVNVSLSFEGRLRIF